MNSSFNFVSTYNFKVIYVFKIDDELHKGILKIYINLKLYVLTKLKLLSILSTPTN